MSPQQPHNPLGIPGERVTSVTQTFPKYRNVDEAIRLARTRRVTGSMVIHFAQGQPLAVEWKSTVKET